MRDVGVGVSRRLLARRDEHSSDTDSELDDDVDDGKHEFCLPLLLLLTLIPLLIIASRSNLPYGVCFKYTFADISLSLLNLPEYLTLSNLFHFLPKR